MQMADAAQVLCVPGDQVGAGRLFFGREPGRGGGEVQGARAAPYCVHARAGLQGIRV